jgi:hypothetical protein
VESRSLFNVGSGAEVSPGGEHSQRQGRFDIGYMRLTPGEYRKQICPSEEVKSKLFFRKGKAKREACSKILKWLRTVV